MTLTYIPENITLKRLIGPEATPWLPQLAELRNEVFREFPLVYEGVMARGMVYLEQYARSLKSIFVVALGDKDAVLGVSVGLPLTDAPPAFQSPFIAQQVPPEDVFYFGESVLAPAARGVGIGHRFFDEREAFAQANGFGIAAFCVEDISPDSLEQPPEYRPHDDFWHERGYAMQPAMAFRFASTDQENNGDTGKNMVFWLRRL